MSTNATKASLPPWGNAVAGATGAVLANTIVYPLDLIKTKLQVQVKETAGNGHVLEQNDVYYASMGDAFSKVVKEEGILGLYSGINSSLLGVASTNFAYFYWYSTVRAFYFLHQNDVKSPNTATELSLGAIAGALAQLFTIPVSVVTTRQQTQRKDEKRGLINTARDVIEGEDGWTGLWRGLKASLILVVNPAITYGAYQKLKEHMFPDSSSLRPWQSFFLGAAAKAVATLLTHPLIVAKVGLQSKPPARRGNKTYKSFVEVLSDILNHEGISALFKGITPQLLKGILVQGLLMMTKDKLELLFMFLLIFVRRVRLTRLKSAARINSKASWDLATFRNALGRIQTAVPVTAR